MGQAIRTNRAIEAGVLSRRAALAFPRRVWAILPGRRGALGSIAAAAILTGVGHGGLALAAGLLARALTRPGANADAGALNVLNVTYLGLGAAAVKAAGSIYSAFSEVSTASNASLALRQRVIQRFCSRGLHDAPPRVLATVAVRLREVETAVVHGAIAGIRAMAQIAPVLAGLIFVSPLLAGVGTFVLVPFAVGLSALRRRWRGTSARAQDAAEALHSGVDELVSNLDLWRVYGATPRLARAVDDAARAALAASARAEAGRAALSGMNEVLGALALVGAVAIAGRAGWSLGDGVLVAFAAMCFMAYRPLRDLGDARAWLERGSIALDALDAATDEVSPPLVEVTPRRFGPGRLEFCRLGAERPGPRTSVSVESGSTLAVVGPTGSGKTTLLRVALGLEPPTGSLLFAGEDLTRRPVGPAYRPFAWVPQDAPLVTGTVLDNVALLSGDQHTARAALETLGAHGLLDSGIVGPGGRALSGGERRLVALARALATELPVLLIDEPCAGLDRAASERVLESLRRLAGKRTLVIVTHREDVMAIADRVVGIGHDTADSDLAAE